MSKKLKKQELPTGCLGYVEDLSDVEVAGKHICSLSGLVFDTEEAYAEHTSPVTDFKPTEIEHHGVLGLRISEKAQKRTRSFKKKQSDALDAKLDKVRKKGTDEQIKEQRVAKKLKSVRLTK